MAIDLTADDPETKDLVRILSAEVFSPNKKRPAPVEKWGHLAPDIERLASQRYAEMAVRKELGMPSWADATPEDRNLWRKSAAMRLKEVPDHFAQEEAQRKEAAAARLQALRDQAARSAAALKRAEDEAKKAVQ